MEPITINRFASDLHVKQGGAITARAAIHLAASVIIFWTSQVYSQTPPSAALRFTADGQNVVVPHTNEVDTISAGLTIEAWVKPEAGILSRGYQSIVSKQLSGTGYMLAINNRANTPIPGFAFKAEVRGIQVTSLSQPAIDGWQHVAAVWDDGQLKLYVNGQFDGVIDTGNPIPNSFDLWIGSSPFGADTNWRGVIDEVRVWAVARTQEQIQSSMNQYLCGNETGLRAYWSFDEGQGQQLLDTVGQSNGFISGAEWVPGVELLSPKNCAAITIAFDVKPDHINPNSRRLLAATVLTTDSFDATTIDPTTIRFGKTGTEATPVDVNKKDVNGDGQPDVLLMFSLQDIGIQCGDSSVSMTGQTVNGTPINGSDSISTVGCKAGKGKKN